MPEAVSQHNNAEMPMTKRANAETGPESGLLYAVAPLLVALILASACAAADQVETPSAIAFVNVSVVPMDSERVLRGQTVYVRNGRIAAIGSADRTEVLTDALLIDGTGRYLVPGLIDMQTHEREAEFPLFVANGVTTVRVMLGTPRFLELRGEIGRGDRLGPDLFVAGPILEGPAVGAASGLAQGWWFVRTREDGRDAVRRQVEAGYDFIKVYNRLSPEAFDGIVETAAELGVPVVGHVPIRVGLDAALRAGMHSIEHLTGYAALLTADDARPHAGSGSRAFTAAWLAADTSRLAGLAERTRAAGVWNTATLVGPRTRSRVPTAELAAYLEGPGGKYMTPGQRHTLMNRYRTVALANHTEADFEAAKATVPVRFALVRALRDAGAGIVAGTDTPVAGFSLHEELNHLSLAGLTNYEVLAAATTNAAQALGRTDRGAIRVGGRADLVLVDGNPLEDLGVLARPAGVVLGGRWLPREALDGILDERVRSLRNILQVAPAARPDEPVPVDSGDGPALSPDGATLYFQDLDWVDNRRLIMIETPGGRSWLEVTGSIRAYRLTDGTTTTIVADRDPIRPLPGFELSPDGETIVFTAFDVRYGAMAIWTVPTAGGEPRRLTTLEATFETVFPRWSPDGGAIAFTVGEGLYRVSVPTGELQRIATKPLWDQDVAWSPDGSWIAATAYLADRRWNTVFLVSADGATVRRLTSGTGASAEHAWHGGIAWRPDGEALAYTCYCGEGEIRLATVDGTTHRTVDLPEGITSGLWTGSWSPDGERLYFLASGQQHGLHVKHTTTGAVQFIGAASIIPTRSADGRTIAWTAPHP